MEDKKKIELYKKRKLSEVLADSMNFIQYNAKAIFKNLALVSLPFAVVAAYFSKYQASSAFSSAFLGMNGIASDTFLTGILVYMLVVIIAHSVIYGTCASMMRKYESEELTAKTRLSDLSTDLLPFSLKTLALFLIVFTVAILIIFLVAFAFLSVLNVRSWVILLLIVLFFTMIVPLSMVFFPMYFKNISIWASFSEGIRIGLKKWGSTFVVLLVGSLFIWLMSMFLSVPYYIALFLQGILGTNAIDITGSGSFLITDIIMYVGSFIMVYGTFLVTPFIFVPLAFQYCRIREEEEGVSMESEIDHFDEI